MNRMKIVFTLLSCLILTVHIIPVKAQTAINSGWTDTHPTIDGVMGLGEWDAAMPGTAFTINGRPATFYVMNDNHNLYVAIVINDDDTASDYCEVTFDEDNDGLLADGDDAFGCGAGGWSGFKDKHWVSAHIDFYWDTGAGDPHGDGAAVQDGITLVWTFELEHPLCSSDQEDFCLYQGSTVGFQIWHADSYADPDWDWWPYEESGEITILRGPSPEHPKPIGGDVFQIEKLAILTPYLFIAVVLFTASILIKKRKH